MTPHVRVRSTWFAAGRCSLRHSLVALAAGCGGSTGGSPDEGDGGDAASASLPMEAGGEDVTVPDAGGGVDATTPDSGSVADAHEADVSVDAGVDSATSEADTMSDAGLDASAMRAQRLRTRVRTRRPRRLRRAVARRALMDMHAESLATARRACARTARAPLRRAEGEGSGRGERGRRAPGWARSRRDDDCASGAVRCAAAACAPSCDGRVGRRRLRVGRCAGGRSACGPSGDGTSGGTATARRVCRDVALRVRPSCADGNVCGANGDWRVGRVHERDVRRSGVRTHLRRRKRLRRGRPIARRASVPTRSARRRHARPASCPDGHGCGATTDCASGVCTNGTCAAPACGPSCRGRQRLRRERRLRVGRVHERRF